MWLQRAELSQYSFSSDNDGQEKAKETTLKKINAPLLMKRFLGTLLNYEILLDKILYPVNEYNRIYYFVFSHDSILMKWPILYAWIISCQIQIRLILETLWITAVVCLIWAFGYRFPQ